MFAASVLPAPALPAQPPTFDSSDTGFQSSFATHVHQQELYYDAKAAAILAQYPDRPLQALWEVVKDVRNPPAFALAIARNPLCGLDREGTAEEGPFTNALGRTMLGCQATPRRLALLSGRSDIASFLYEEQTNKVDASKIEAEAAEVLAKCHGRPLKAMWHILTKFPHEPSFVVAMALNPMCGLNRRGTEEDDPFVSCKKCTVSGCQATPLVLAAAECRSGIVRSLVDLGAGTEADLSIALHAALANGPNFSVSYLLAAGADVTYTYQDGKNALHLAAAYPVLSNVPSNVDCLQEVLQHYSSLEAVDNEGATALHEAFRLGRTLAAEALIANIRALDKRGRTPFHIGTRYGTQTTKALIRKMEPAIAQDLLQIKDANGRTVPQITGDCDAYGNTILPLFIE